MKLPKSWTVVFAALLLGCGDGASPAGPLEPIDPIEARIQQLFPEGEEPPFGNLNRDQIRRMLQVPPEEDEPFYMLNLIKHYDVAQYPDGRESDLSGAAADGIYGSLVLPILAEIGARPVFVSSVELNLIDGDQAGWTQIAIVRYPSRAAFFGMLERDDFQDASIHKVAGVEKTIVMVAQREVDEFPASFYEVDLEALPTPPTPDDPPIAICHILDYHDIAQYADGRETTLTGREAMDLYSQGRFEQDVIGMGVRPGLWLEIEGELLGRGSQFEEFRVNNFPNRETFFQIANAESFAEAGGEHRLAAIKETYTQLTVPLLNEDGYR